MDLKASMPPTKDRTLGLRCVTAIALVAIGWWIGGPIWIAATTISATWVLIFKDVRPTDTRASDLASDLVRETLSPVGLDRPRAPDVEHAVESIEMEGPLDFEDPLSSGPENHDATLTVLVCEDDSLVRNLVTYVLQRHGHTVISTDDGKRALEISRGHEPGFDALVTDMRVPGMTGAELAAKVRDVDPSFPVVFMSGFTQLVHRDPIFRAPNTVLLAKPFRPADLQRALMDVWGERPSPASEGVTTSPTGRRPGGAGSPPSDAGHSRPA